MTYLRDKTISFWFTINVIVISLVIMFAFTWVSNRLIRFIKSNPIISVIMSVIIGFVTAFQSEIYVFTEDKVNKWA